MIDVRDVFGVGREDGAILKVLSRNGVSDILFSLEESPKRFSQLMFEARLNPGVLDRHLKVLMGFELVVKVDGRYELTERGRRAVNTLHALLSVFTELSKS